MSHLNTDREKCSRRNRLAGLRGDAECSRVRWLPREDLAAATVSARGTLPKDDAEAMAKINAGIPGPALSEEQVYIHYMEAASDRFIADRHMFLHSSTLRNIARQANAGGFAFMNSHRTGDLSTPSELPFGRAFAGQYRTVRAEDGSKVRSAVLGVYMLRGQQPNGANGPSTDSLSASISGGTIFDVSMGLYGGRRVCDVCGQDFNAKDPEGRYLCDHVPGTHRKMTPDQMEAQKAKGVPEGKATYTLHDAEPGEVSAVYDGAIPGAGFRKALSLKRSNLLSRSDWREALAAYPSLNPDRKDRKMPKLQTILSALRLRNPDLAEEVAETLEGQDFGPEVLTQPARFSAGSAGGNRAEESNDAEIARLRKELEAERLKNEERERRESAACLAREKADGERFASDLVSERKAVPAEKDALAALHSRLARLDREHPVADGPTGLSLLTNLTALRTRHTLTREEVAANKSKLTTLPTDPADGDEEAEKEDLAVLGKATREAVGLK